MKKMMTIICCICMVFVLTACGESDEPQKVTANFLDAYSKKDENKIKTYSQWKDYSIKALMIQESDYIDGVDKKIQKQVFEMMQSFDYKVGKETINDDNASVQVTLTIYDFDTVVKEGLEEATAKAEELSKQSDISDADAQAQINTIVFKHMKDAKQNKKKKININLVKDRGDWLVSNDNADIQNILISNMKSLQDLNN